MVNILSIDFDYFIDATAEEREKYFPDGSPQAPEDEVKKMWDGAYKNCPEIYNIDVIDNYLYIKNLLESCHVKETSVAESHKYIKELLDKIPKNKPIRVINIDFHHDYYHYFCNGEEYNCGNWLRRLIEGRPDTEVKWIRREDSQTLTLEGKFPFENSTDITELINIKFDYIFICKSPEWTPPHLYKKFKELIRNI